MGSKTGLSRDDEKSNSPKSASSRGPNAAAADQSFPVETAGEFFPGGASIELIADPESGQLRLLFTNGQTSRVAHQIEYRGRTYIPLRLDARILRAVGFLHQASDYVSTAQLCVVIQLSWQQSERELVLRGQPSYASSSKIWERWETKAPEDFVLGKPRK